MFYLDIVWGSIIYYGSLVTCASIGSSYRAIDDWYLKRSYGAGLGLLIICLVCGESIMYTILMVWGNIIIIKCCDKRYLHLLSLGYSWSYLIFFHYHLEATDYVIWIHQILALRLVGLAYEVAISNKIASRKRNTAVFENTVHIYESAIRDKDRIKIARNIYDLDKDSTRIKRMDLALKRDMISLMKDPTAAEIISYVFFYVGIHKGPYYRWKIYNDHFRDKLIVECRSLTLEKFKHAFLYGVLYLLLEIGFPSKFYYCDEFYTEYSPESRFLYGLPQLMGYYCRLQMLLLLATSVCTEAGFGVYPHQCCFDTDEGPSKRISFRSNTGTKSQAVSRNVKHNLFVLKSLENKVHVLSPSLRETLRYFDMSTKSWFRTYIYKHTIYTEKFGRLAFTLLTWSLWHGASLQDFCLAGTTWLYLRLEEEYMEYYLIQYGQVWNVAFGLMRYLYLVYMIPCLIIKDFQTIFKFYNSILWAYHVILLILFTTVFFGTKSLNVNSSVKSMSQHFVFHSSESKRSMQTTDSNKSILSLKISGN